jgi:hypothetical protein
MSRPMYVPINPKRARHAFELLMHELVDAVEDGGATLVSTPADEPQEQALLVVLARSIASNPELHTRLAELVLWAAHQDGDGNALLNDLLACFARSQTNRLDESGAFDD